MGIVKLLLCYAWKGDKLTIRKWNGIGQRKAYKSPRGTRNDDDFIHKDSSVIRLRPTNPNHIWFIDFVHDKLSNGRSYKMLTVLDEFTCEALSEEVRSKTSAYDVLDALYPLLIKHGKPEFICSDNGPEFVSAKLREWLQGDGIKSLNIYSGSPWENGYNERFIGTLRREVLNA